MVGVELANVAVVGPIVVPAVMKDVVCTAVVGCGADVEVCAAVEVVLAVVCDREAVGTVSVVVIRYVEELPVVEEVTGVGVSCTGVEVCVREELGAAVLCGTDVAGGADVLACGGRVVVDPVVICAVVVVCREAAEAERKIHYVTGQ